MEHIDVRRVRALVDRHDLDAKIPELFRQVVNVLRRTRPDLTVSVQVVRIQTDLQLIHAEDVRPLKGMDVPVLTRGTSPQGISRRSDAFAHSAMIGLSFFH